MIKPAQAGLLALILGACALGFAPIFVRLSEVGPVSTAFYRLALSLPVFAVLAWPHRGIAVGQGSALAGAFFAADLSVWHAGILLTSIANATLFTNLAPVFVTLGLWLIWGQRPSRRFVMALGLAVAGAIMLMGGSLRLSPERLAGDGLSLLSGAFYGAYILTVGRSRSMTMDRSRSVVPAAVLMLRSGAVASVLVLPVALALGETVLPHTLHGWAVLLGLALITQVAGQGLIAWGLAHLPSSFGAVVLLLQPLVATLVAWGLFGEALGVLELTGAGVVLLGMYCAHRASRA